MSKRGSLSFSSKGVTPTAWTEYIKFLPSHVPVPSLWSEYEKSMLRGTSLEKALEAHFRKQVAGFDLLREKSSSLPFWNSLFWENGTVSLQDWMLVDAWFRSRSLELPYSGYSMAPVVDIANHSSKANAWFDQDAMGNVSLSRRPGFAPLSEGMEVFLSYGEKPAAEMLFSYGFIDAESPRKEMRLPLEIPDDDPLAKAKVLISGGQAPMVKVYQDDDGYHWVCPFLHLMVLNEEDGLEFRILQDKEGERELRLFWQEEDVTSRPDEFESLTADHPLCQLFRLRVVLRLEQQLEGQLQRLQDGPEEEMISQLVGADLIRPETADWAQMLRLTETKMLSGMLDVLNKSVSLISSLLLTSFTTYYPFLLRGWDASQIGTALHYRYGPHRTFILHAGLRLRWNGCAVSSIRLTKNLIEK